MREEIELAQAFDQVQQLVQIGSEAEANVEAEAEAEAESEMIMKMMKPFLGPIMDLFMDILFHGPWVVCNGGRKVGKDCVYDDWKPIVTSVTTHKKPNVYNFGHKPGA